MNLRYFFLTWTYWSRKLILRNHEMRKDRFCKKQYEQIFNIEAREQPHSFTKTPIIRMMKSRRSSRKCFLGMVLLKIELCTWNLLRSPTLMLGYLENLSEITSKCCLAKIIVGARTIACFPAETTQKMARSATSVLPKPTSPQINLSIGFSLSVKSLSTSEKACHWNPKL